MAGHSCASRERRWTRAGRARTYSRGCSSGRDGVRTGGCTSVQAQGTQASRCVPCARVDRWMSVHQECGARGCTHRVMPCRGDASVQEQETRADKCVRACTRTDGWVP